MAWVYIARMNNGQLYIGSTADLEQRAKQHFSGHTKTTKRLGFLTIVFKQEYPNLNDARAVERKLKRLKRRDYIEKIIKEGYIKSMRGAPL